MALIPKVEPTHEIHAPWWPTGVTVTIKGRASGYDRDRIKAASALEEARTRPDVDRFTREQVVRVADERYRAVLARLAAAAARLETDVTSAAPQEGGTAQ